MRSVSDHLPATGTWFHCQIGWRRAAEKSSLRWYGTVGGVVVPVPGFTQMRGDRPRFFGRPKYGQPSDHVTGDSAVRRPTELASIIEKPHHSPAGVSTIPP